jgi:hypothetical protein
VAVLVDGSFVTATPAPNDIDLIVLAYPGHDFAAELGPVEYNVLSKRAVRKRYAFDVLVAADGSELAEQYREFFARVRDRRAFKRVCCASARLEARTRPGAQAKRGRR